jgi:hypothetical protein
MVTSLQDLDLRVTALARAETSSRQGGHSTKRKQQIPENIFHGNVRKLFPDPR